MGYTVRVAQSLTVIYGSSTGHTEHVARVASAWFAAHDTHIAVRLLRAEQAAPEDLLRDDALVLACGTWNTGGPEGQLNPYMHALLIERCVGLSLQGTPVWVVALGDDRYRYKARSAEYMEQFVESHGGRLMAPTLRIINEPYGQEATVESWAAAVRDGLLSLD